MIRRGWQAVGIAGDTNFLIASLGGIATLGAIGAGLLAGLTAIPTVYLVVASVGLILFLSVIVPLGLSRVWPMLTGPALVIGDWHVKFKLKGNVSVTEASVSVWNARDAGGERALAKGVVPQLEVFAPDGRRLYHHVGWTTTNQRDFPATREEERILLATKSTDSPHYMIGHCPPVFATSMNFVEGRLTLRGANLVRPIIATFTMGLGPKGELWVEGG